MNLNDALNRIIDDGIKAVRNDYTRPEDDDKLKGSIAGFEECRGKQPSEIVALRQEAHEKMMQAHAEHANDYWYWRCRESEIEWVINVLSNIMHAQGWTPIGIMTYRGAMKAAEIIGVGK